MFKKDVLLKDYTTYGIGGPAKQFVEVISANQMQEVLKCCDRFIVIGKGSNLLFDDRGFDGTVIYNKIQSSEWLDDSVHVGSGFSFALLGAQSARKGLSGLEFASGIPGSVGGAVFMNAGANGMETKDAITEVGFVNADGTLEVFSKEEIQFAYRTSLFHSLSGAIVSATFALRKAEGAKKRQKEIIEYRTSTQPYGEKSCGCAFRNPPGDAAGRLIEACGLKEFSIGGATVSPVHANFIVNLGDAKAQDILDLMKYVQVKVAHKSGIQLQPEVRFIPYQKESLNEV